MLPSKLFQIEIRSYSNWMALFSHSFILFFFSTIFIHFNTSIETIVTSEVSNYSVSSRVVDNYVSALSCPSDSLGGTVWIDYNANGVEDTYEQGRVEDVAVSVYDCDGNLVATDTTDGNGVWFVDPMGITFPVRVEFSNIPSSTYWTLQGMDSETSVQFIDMPRCDVDVALEDGSRYCESNPTMITPCYVEDNNPNADVIVSFSYENVGTAPQDKTTVSESQQAGSLWGVAYDKEDKILYTAALLKRHVQLGPEGLDAIYTIDPFSGTPNATPWLEFTDDLGIAVSNFTTEPQYLTNVDRELTDGEAEHDATTFSDVGKVGFGDIELSEDGETLYVVNLYDKTLYAISTTTKMVIASFPIPDPNCQNGEARPWALGEQEGEIYVGVTCDGSASGNPANLADNSGVNNLTATVYQLTGTSFTQVLNFPLNYPREVPFQYTGGCDQVNRWKPWTDVQPTVCDDGNIGYPTPLLSDIEFADNGDMILGFLDRTGLQFGNGNYGPIETTQRSLYSGGDILKACLSGGTWSIESTASGCSSPGGLAINTYDNDGYDVGFDFLDKQGEFYEGDFFHGDGNWDGTGLSYFPGHPEIATGGLAVVPGTGEVMTTSYDPVTGANNFGTGGVIVLSNTTGQRTRNGFQLYDDVPEVNAGKGIGLGDLEALCSNPPIQIGNYVWYDPDKDGIQDACEMGIAGVNVSLYQADGTFVATTTTSADGFYYFTDYEEHGIGYDTLSPDSMYFVVVGEGGQFSTSNNMLSIGGNNYELTAQNTGQGANPDINDSDAYLINTGSLPFNGFPVDTITIGGLGFVDHTLDFGFMPPRTCFSIDSLVADRVICAGQMVDTLAVTTTYSDTNSIAFVWFTDAQTDSSTIYSAGTGLDTIAISAASDTVAIFDIATFTNTGSVADTFYVYAIVLPIPSEADCRPYEEIKIIAHPSSIDVSGNPISTCEGTTLSLTASGTGTAPLSYQWLGPNSFSSTLENPTLDNVTSSATGTYIVTLMDGNTCTDTAHVSVNILDKPSVTVNDVLRCTENTATITASATGVLPLTPYVWNGPFVTNPGNVASFSTTIVGDYSVTVTDGNGCTGTDTGTLTYQPRTCLSATFTIRRGSRSP